VAAQNWLGSHSTQCWTMTTTTTMMTEDALHNGDTKLMPQVQVAVQVQVKEYIEV